MTDMPAGGELDALVAERVMGKGRYMVPRYSTSIGAAWLIVEHMAARGWSYCVDNLGLEGEESRCVFWRDNGEPSPVGEAMEAPLAIVRAALRAVGAAGSAPHR